ncbi:MAG: right-handed parallel beta-helix repeat-containing protein [bacterium]|nr:right-handed parallel beta-helix repeat-containing protein [bacterium]
MKKKIMIASCVIFFLTSQAQAVTRLVKAGGGTGFSNTIASALTNCLPGDIVEICDNSLYIESLTLDTPYIILRGASGYRPAVTFSGTGIPALYIKTNNVVVRNLNVSSSSVTWNNSVILITASHNSVQDCRITGDSMIWTNTGIRISSMSNEISNCDIGNNLYYGINLNGALYTRIQNNDIHDCRTGVYGIGDQTLINFNIIRNIQGEGLFLAGMGVNSIIYNLLYLCSSSAILIDAAMAPYNIIHNTITKNSTGIMVQYMSSPNSDIINNIIYDNGTDLYLNGLGQSPVVNINNNCYSHSQIFNLNMPQNIHINNSVSDPPEFINSSLNDFHLSQTSPCIDAGTDIGGLDPNAIIREPANQRDIGFYETTLSTTTNLPQITDNIRISANNLYPGKTARVELFDLNKISEKPIYVKAGIYDMQARLIRTLCETPVSPFGTFVFSWDGKDKNNQYVGAGIYFLKIQINDQVKRIKLFFLQ